MWKMNFESEKKNLKTKQNKIFVNLPSDCVAESTRVLLVWMQVVTLITAFCPTTVGSWVLFDTDLLYLCCGIIDWRTFFSGCNKIIYNFGENRHNSVTVALNDIDTDNVVMFNAIWLLCEEVKYIGTNANQIMHVVYIVKPMNFDSLNASGILRVSTAYTVHTTKEIYKMKQENKLGKKRSSKLKYKLGQSKKEREIQT